MKKFAKIIAIVFCLSLILSVALSLTGCKNDKKLGDFYYRVKSDNTVAVYVDEYNSAFGVSFDVYSKSAIGGVISKSNLSVYAGSSIGVNKGIMSACKAKAYNVEKKETGTKVETWLTGNSNQANLYINNASQYEGIIGSNEGDFKIEKFVKLD